MTNVAAQAISLSQVESRIVTIDAAHPDIDDICMGLLAECTDWHDGMDRDQGTPDEYWGGEDGYEWRVHICPTDSRLSFDFA